MCAMEGSFYQGKQEIPLWKNPPSGPLNRLLVHEIGSIGRQNRISQEASGRVAAKWMSLLNSRKANAQ